MPHRAGRHASGLFALNAVRTSAIQLQYNFLQLLQVPASFLQVAEKGCKKFAKML